MLEYQSMNEEWKRVFVTGKGHDLFIFHNSDNSSSFLTFEKIDQTFMKQSVQQSTNNAYWLFCLLGQKTFCILNGQMKGPIVTIIL